MNFNVPVKSSRALATPATHSEPPLRTTLLNKIKNLILVQLQQCYDFLHDAPIDVIYLDFKKSFDSVSYQDSR